MAKTKATKHSESSPKKANPIALGGDLVLGALLAELIGTFILTACLLNSAGNAIIAAVTVMVLVMVLSRLSGAHLNPAISLGLWATKQVSALKAAGFIVAQLLGAMLALIVVTQFVNATPVTPEAPASPAVFATAELTEQWRPFMGEALGALVFSFGVAAAIFGRKNSHEAGFMIGGSLLLGLIIATLGGAGILNPAVALGLSAYTANIWTILVYAIAPVLGAVAGVWLYKLLQWDVTGSKELPKE